MQKLGIYMNLNIQDIYKTLKATSVVRIFLHEPHRAYHGAKQFLSHLTEDI